MSALYGFTGPLDPELLEGMSRILAHRGSRNTSRCEKTDGSIGYGEHSEQISKGVRVSGIHESADLVLAVAGHVHATDGFRLDLAELSSRYGRHGISFVDDLQGAFVLAILDGDTLHLARDGAGARSIYYGKASGRWLFAVEPKGIWTTPGFHRRLRPAAVAQYLTFSFIPGNCTMLEDLWELPAGTRVTLKPGAEPVLHRYFRFEEARNGQPQNPNRWVEPFLEKFGQAVEDRLPAGEPVGVFLSGGIDSSVVAAEVVRRHNGPVKTYSIHFGNKYPNELEYARAVADRLGTDHEEVLVRPRDFLPRLRQTIWHLDDPVGDPVAMPNFELARRVSRDVRWVFNGEGGDPCLGGPKNIPMLLHHWYGGIDRQTNFREQAYLASYRRSYDDLARLVSPDFKKQIDPERDLESILTPFFRNPHPRLFLDKLVAINLRLKGASLILPKVERMTGAWGITPLSPLFDERIIQLSFAMPPELRLSNGIEKVILKRAYADVLPEEVIQRPKSGMRVPVHFWFQKEMKRFAKRLLHPRRIREAGIFNENRVRQLLAYETEEGPGRYGLRLWMLMTFEIWREIVIEGGDL